jgi:hypothetical protein
MCRSHSGRTFQTMRRDATWSSSLRSPLALLAAGALFLLSAATEQWASILVAVPIFARSRRPTTHCGVFPADELVFATHAERDANWLEQDVVEIARNPYGVPVTHIAVDSPTRPDAGS